MSTHLKQQHKTTEWSGGSTTELFIYPETSNYKDGNYAFRLSTATVEVEESTFTSLPGVDRTLVLLEGSMELHHEGHHSAMLLPVESDRFQGGWTTHSKGTCVDFNLMCTAGTEGSAQGFSMMKNSEKDLLLDGVFNFIYVHNGEVSIAGRVLNTGDLLRLDDSLTSQTITSHFQSTFVVVKIDGLP